MGIDGLPSTSVTIPFAAGLNTRGDKRAKNPPSLDVALNVEFDDLGGLRTRYPYGAANSSLLGGGTILNVRKLATNGDELLMFAKDTLYSWNAQQSKWMLRGEHLAVKTSERTVFATTGDQQAVDRAELSNVILYVWQEPITTFYTAQPIIYAAAVDKTTGATILTPTAIAGGNYNRAPRVVALDTKFLLFFQPYLGHELRVLALDPTNITASTIGAAGTQIIAAASLDLNLSYDVEKIPGADSAILVARRNPTTSYEIVKVTSALAVTSATKARTCNGPIAVSCALDGQVAQVVRANGTNIQGDQIAISTLADVFTAQAVGTATTTVYQIAVANYYDSGNDRHVFYAFWGVDEEPAGGAAQVTKSNWVDTGNSLGTQSLFQPWMSVASRAFEYNNRVFFWGIFNASSSPASGGRLQGTYFLFRDDGKIFAKATGGNAYWASLVGILPGVALTSGSTVYSWAGCFTRNVEVSSTLSDQSGSFRARAPRDITFTFDSNEARRVARFGNTLYVAGGEILQYDGAQLAELGFHVAPYRFKFGDGGAGNVEIGTYGYEATLRWLNAAGEIDRSSSFGVTTFAVAASNKKLSTSTGAGGVPINSIWTTHKPGAAVEMWRTAKNPTADAPLYLVSGQDPSVPATTTDNGFIYNDTTAASEANFIDNYADATATTNETHPENGGILENLAPPPATIIAATQNRLYLAGVAGLPDQVWYSKLRETGKVASFNDALTIDVPKDGGDITALAFLQETLVVFRERAIYMLPGDGFDNTGGGSNYGPARIISLEVGAVNQESVVLVPDGLLFKCEKGWYLLSKGWDVQYIGAPVYAYDSETPLAAHVMPAQHQVRILTSNRMLVWDYLVNQWGEWTISGGLDAAVWNGAHQYLSGTGIRAQQTTYAGVDYGFDVETVWIKINELQGRGLVREIKLLGEYRGAHSVRVRLARNYESDGAGGWSYNYDTTWTVSPTTVGGPEQLRVAPKYKRCQAIKVRLTALAPDKVSQPSGETAKLTGLSLSVAVEEGLYQGLAAAQKQ